MKRLLCLIPLTLALACAKYEPVPMTEISISFDGSVEWKQVTSSATGAATTNETYINGMPYSLENGTLRIGDKSFAGLFPGDAIHVGADGISVNGEHRWDLPK